MNYKRMLAGVLAAGMVMGNSAIALADEGSASGTGSLDIVEKSDVFSVELPTVPTGGITTFNYILDPTGVISETGAEKYEKATFGKGTVFFANAPATDGGAVTYSDTSDALTVTNKSTMDVDVTVEASVEAVEGIKMVSSKDFAADNKDAGLYLALKDSVAANADQAITADTPAKQTSTIDALDNAYEVKFVNGKYVKQLKSDATGFNTYSFQLTGACNPNGNWSGLTEKPPVVDVIWTVTDPNVAAAVSLSEAGLITISGLTADANIADASVDLTLGINGEMYPINTSAATWITDDWTPEKGGTLKAQLNSPYAAFNGETVSVAVKLTNGVTINCRAKVEIK